MKTQSKFSALVLAGLLLTQGARAHTETLSATTTQPANVETYVVTAKAESRVAGAETASTLQHLKEEAAKELQQQVAAGSFLPELVQSATREVSQELVRR